jgi:CO/xanthine dehydrogenase Mo-binding subunit
MKRRTFLKRSGALVVGFSASSMASTPVVWFGADPGAVAAQRLDGAGSNQLDSWIAIAADGNVTAYTGKCELGHGLHTAQTQLVAEELGVPFGRVTLVQCDTAFAARDATAASPPARSTGKASRPGPRGSCA